MPLASGLCRALRKFRCVVDRKGSNNFFFRSYRFPNTFSAQIMSLFKKPGETTVSLDRKILAGLLSGAIGMTVANVRWGGLLDSALLDCAAEGASLGCLLSWPALPFPPKISREVQAGMRKLAPLNSFILSHPQKCSHFVYICSLLIW